MRGLGMYDVHTIACPRLARTRHRADGFYLGYSQRPDNSYVRIIQYFAELLNFPKTTKAARSNGAIVHNLRAIVHQLFITLIFT
jgi:hypothetical protein